MKVFMVHVFPRLTILAVWAISPGLSPKDHFSLSRLQCFLHRAVET